MVGLVDAANKYDPNKGVKFKTFAEYRVRGAIFDEMRKLDWFSRSMRDKQNQLTRTMLRITSYNVCYTKLLRDAYDINNSTGTAS